MYGAILGDIIGSPYEFDRGSKTKSFSLFSKYSQFTDDTVMTLAVAEAFLPVQPEMEDDTIRQRLVAAMQKYGRRYLYAGYGTMFRRWLRAKNPQPYGSFGNGSAMRVSAVGWLYSFLVGRSPFPCPSALPAASDSPGAGVPFQSAHLPVWTFRGGLQGHLRRYFHISVPRSKSAGKTPDTSPPPVHSPYRAQCRRLRSAHVLPVLSFFPWSYRFLPWRRSAP